MKITFNRVDKEYYGVREYIDPIVNITVKYNDFIQVLCTVLNTYDSYSEHIVNDVDKVLKLHKSLYEDNMSDIEKKDFDSFHKNVYNFYWNVVDDDFGNKLRQFDEDIYRKEQLRYPDKRLGRYRGLLLEEIVAATVKGRFQKGVFCAGCRIYVNGSRIIARYGIGDAKHKETIDIAGWNETVSYGEFYECKINPIRFEFPNYKYFIELKKTLDSNNVRKYIIAVVSSEERRHLKAQIDFIELENPGYCIDFEIIGREDIYNISNYNIPEIA